MYKIVILDGRSLNDMDWSRIEAQGDVTFYDSTPANLVMERSKDADVLIINKIVMTRQLMESLPRLRYIGITATGYNTVDIAAARDLGIAVTNIPGYSTDSVAQHVFALLLAVAVRVEHYAEANRNGRWSAAPDFCYADFPSFELAGKTLGIFGLGNIGQAVARIALAFGMRVLACTSKAAETLPVGVVKVTLDELYAQSDIITYHCPLTPETDGIICSASIDRMRRGVVLINTARGALANEAELAVALRDGRVGAYCADVVRQEPPAADCPLLSAPNCWLTPHMAWMTKEARGRLLDICAENLEAFTEGKPLNLLTK